MISKEPDRLNIKKTDRETYDRLSGDDSPLKDMENKYLFLMAMALGYYHNTPLELDTKEGYIRSEYLTYEEKSLINAIAIMKVGDLSVLLDIEKVFSIAEQYAAGGIKILEEIAFSPEYGSFVKRFESELVKVFNEKVK